MCGRYSSSLDPDDLVRWFHVDDVRTETLAPSYNVAPTTENYVVLEREKDGEVQRQLRSLRWGLVPSWAKDLAIGNRMINARVETLAESGAFKRAYAKRRCLVPADGWYEWYAEPGRKTKQPFFIHRRDGGPVAFAGLYEIWKVPGSEDEFVWSYAVVTRDATKGLGHIHDRMPQVLPESAWDAWLDPERSDVADLLVPPPDEELDAYPVSRDVNNVRTNDPRLKDPLPAEGADGAEGDAEEPALF